MFLDVRKNVFSIELDGNVLFLLSVIGDLSIELAAIEFYVPWEYDS